MIRTNDSFPFGKGGSGVLANCSLCGTEATRFQQVEYAQVFLLKPGPFCKLFAGLGSINKSSTSLLLPSDFRSVLTTLSSPPSNLLPQTLWQELSSLSPVLSVYNGSPDTRFSRGTTWLISWPGEERYLRPPQSLVVSLLLPFVSNLLFSRTGGVGSHLNSSTHRFPQFPPRNLCFLITLAVFSLVYTATDTVYCEAFISSGLTESRILPAAPADTLSRIPLISFCTVQLQTLRRSLFGDSLSLYDLWSRPYEVARLLGLHGHPPCPHPSEGVG